MKLTPYVALITALTLPSAHFSYAQPNKLSENKLTENRSREWRKADAGDDLDMPDLSDDHDAEKGLAKKLNLSKEQKEKIKEIRSSREDKEKLMLKNRLAHVELRELLEKDGVTDEEILSKAKTISDMMAEQKMERLRKVLAMRKILTPEQRKAFKSAMQERRDSRSSRHEGMREHM